MSNLDNNVSKCVYQVYTDAFFFKDSLEGENKAGCLKVSVNLCFLQHGFRLLGFCWLNVLWCPESVMMCVSTQTAEMEYSEKWSFIKTPDNVYM